MLARELLTAVRLTLAFVLATGVGFPAVLYGLAHAAFPWQAETSLVRDRCGVIVGSALVGQQFSTAGWFHGRPSAVGYNAASSGGSNLGPTNAVLDDSLRARADQFRIDNGVAVTAPLPSDAFTASGSGIDPGISLEMAALQVARVSRERRGANASAMDSVALDGFVRDRATAAWPGNGVRTVNVLMLNLALDSASGVGAACGARLP